MVLDLEKYTWTDGQTDVSAAELNGRFYPIIRRIHALEQISTDWETAISEVRNYGLSRVNDAIRPLIDGLKADLEALIAQGQADLASQSAAVDALLAEVDERMVALGTTLENFQMRLISVEEAQMRFLDSGVADILKNAKRFSILFG